MNEDCSVEGAIRAVNEAENAVIQAQSYSSPQYLQAANQKLMYASQQLHGIQDYLNPDDDNHQKHIHRAMEQLRNLQENQNSLL
jgi:replication-associated recombination protein RarA